MTKQQIKQINNSYRNSDYFVFSIGERVFVAEVVLKHRKEATVEMVNSQEVDDTCFEPNGEYYGECLEKTTTIILDDPFADQPNTIASVYYEDEVKEGL